MSEHAEPTEPETADDGVADAEFDLDAREWFRQFRAFVKEHVPFDGTPNGDGDIIEINPRVRVARDLALVAAFRALGRMAGRFDPPPEMPPFALTERGR